MTNLFNWSPPPCQMLAFPLNKQVGKIRNVAHKLSNKATDKHAAYYRIQVDEALRSHLAKASVAPDEQARQITAFWSAVRNEMQRLACHSLNGESRRGSVMTSKVIGSTRHPIRTDITTGVL